MTKGAGALDMMQMLADLTPLNRVCCSTDYDKTVDYLCEVLPFRVLEFRADDEHNGWVIPPKWDVTKAEIRYRGRRDLRRAGARARRDRCFGAFPRHGESRGLARAPAFRSPVR